MNQQLMELLTAIVLTLQWITLIVALVRASTSPSAARS